MAGGLFALLDDVAALAKLAAASVDDVGAAAGRATGKAAGVVIDDTAVTPQYVRGVAAERELPLVRRIATGSIKNKLVFILPVLLLLSEFASFLLTPLLMLGGLYLVFEAGEKILHAWSHRGSHAPDAAESAEPAEPEPADEDTIVSNAVRTDLILSAEIMVIALDSIDSESFWSRLVILFVVAVAVTVGVYGVVGLIVKADDVGLRLAESSRAVVAKAGLRLVAAMPAVMKAISVIGTAAMLWVGGHILVIGLDELGFTLPYDAVHAVEEAVRDALEGAGVLAGVAAWVVDTLGSAVVGAVAAVPLVAAATWWHGRGSHEGADHGATA
ncbi:DUF808 domain-containing protein [Nocardioidaceae bacterium]|nr:DUF808 domain-containing protein [Nocardioidaceae bacterium]